MEQPAAAQILQFTIMNNKIHLFSFFRTDNIFFIDLRSKHIRLIWLELMQA